MESGRGVAGEFTLRQLRYFVAAAATGTTQAAAAEMYVSQSAMSSAIAELEASLGTQLFVRRRGKGLGLTDTGRSLLPMARELLADADDLRAVAQHLQGDLEGALTIACFDVLAPSLLPRLLRGFSERYPMVELDFIDGNRQELATALETGRAEVAIMFEAAVTPAMTSAVAARPEPHLLVPAGHRLASPEPVSLHEVADEPLLLMDAEPGREFVLQSLRSIGVTPKVRFRSRSMSVIRALVARGFGYALVIQGSRLDGRVAPDGVVAVPVTDLIAPDVIVIARPSGAQLTRRAAAFWAYTLETLGERGAGAAA